MNYANPTQQPPQSITALRAALLLALGVVAADSRAQSAAPAPVARVAADAPRVVDLERVTITATRRREPVREVPVQINTIDAEQLEREGARWRL